MILPQTYPYVLALMILAWALPSDSGGLQFSEAEIAFLFPAPLRRRDLLLYKIIRAQPQALFVGRQQVVRRG